MGEIYGATDTNVARRGVVDLGEPGLLLRKGRRSTGEADGQNPATACHGLRLPTACCLLTCAVKGAIPAGATNYGSTAIASISTL